MNKYLLGIGKVVMVLAAILTLPITFDLFKFHPQFLGVEVWGRGLYFWWPLLIVFVIGFLLCLASRYKCEDQKIYAEHKLRETFVGLSFKIFWWGVKIMIGFWGIILSIKLLHFLFLTEAINYTVPIMFGIIGIVFLIIVGLNFAAYYDDRKEKREEDLNPKASKKSNKAYTKSRNENHLCKTQKNPKNQNSIK